MNTKKKDEAKGQGLADAHVRQRHIAMINDPKQWPYFMLPMKKQDHQNKDENFGLIWSDLNVKKPKPVLEVRIANMFRSDDWDIAKRIKYPTVEAIVDDGWVVD